MFGVGSDQWLGVKCDTHSRDIEHGPIVGAVPNRYDLIEGNVFTVCDFSQQFRLSVAINDVGAGATCHNAAFDLQLIGEQIVDSKPLLQMLAEKRKLARKDGGLVAQQFQSGNELL